MIFRGASIQRQQEGGSMRRVALMVFASVLLFSFGAAAQTLNQAVASSAPAGAAAEPPAFNGMNEFPIRVYIGYEFFEFRNQDNLTFHNNGIKTDFTGYLGHDFALEGSVTGGFGWARYSPTLNLESSSIFYGGGIRIGPQHRRFQPWVHVLVGGERLRFTQTAGAIGDDNGFAYLAGVGADYMLGPRFFWRFSGDYLGTREFGANQENYEFGTGVGFSF
jgi:hypothetical protein